MALPKMPPEEARLDARLQNLAAKYYCAQVGFHNAQRECVRLLMVAWIKNEVIGLLLPYCPHSVMPELHYKISMV